MARRRNPPESAREEWLGVPRARGYFSNQLRDEYRRLFATCKIRANRVAHVEAAVAGLTRNKRRYVAVGKPLGVPWALVAVIHSLESGADFRTHLHNGDPLTARTKNRPSGRPPTGRPPFAWEDSARDALMLKKLHEWGDWSIEGMLFKLELYNGWGYRKYHPDVLTPYLWSFSQHYTRGKYRSDGKWDANLVSAQCGAAVLLKRMAAKGLVEAETERGDVEGVPVDPRRRRRPSGTAAETS